MTIRHLPLKTFMFDIIVVASHDRQAVITDYLSAYEHKISYAPKYPFPRRYVPHPDFRSLGIKHHVGPFRCFRGHQDALKKSTENTMLVFEDDALPSVDNWHDIAERSTPLLDHYEIVSLHGRNIIVDGTFDFDGLKFTIPGPASAKIKWSLGSLAYLLRKETAEKIIKMQYRGLPMDLLLASQFSFCTLSAPCEDGPSDSPFLHERKFGSLVEKAR
jgi:hypothetical protein